MSKSAMSDIALRIRHLNREVAHAAELADLGHDAAARHCLDRLHWSHTLFHRGIGEVRDHLGIPFLTSSNGPSAPDDDEVLADHPFLKAALATGDSAEIKRAIEVETAREAILRIAHERPELRPLIYEMVKETSEELQARPSARA